MAKRKEASTDKERLTKKNSLRNASDSAGTERSLKALQSVVVACREMKPAKPSHAGAIAAVYVVDYFHESGQHPEVRRRQEKESNTATTTKKTRKKQKPIGIGFFCTTGRFSRQCRQVNLQFSLTDKSSSWRR